MLATEPRGAYAQGELGRLRVMWLNEQYAEVLPQLLLYRDLPYGRNVTVDYMIATSACHLPVLREDALSYFQWILYHYRLTTNDRKVVEAAKQQCASGKRPADVIFVTERAEAGVSGKTAFVPGDPKAPITSASIEIVREIPRRQLFRPAERETAKSDVARLVQRVSPNFQVAATDQFILASSSGHPPDELLDIGKELERVLGFFNSEFGVPPPPYLITVYMVPSPEALQQLADKLHGFRLPGASIGYSFQNDLSIVGWILLGFIGTLTHELFHVAVRNHFGDIQPWMDEGMAALYEESHFDQDRLVGVKNWRGPALKQLWRWRPTIEQLVKMDWPSFDALGIRSGEQQNCQAANHATARYFALYLQDQGKLPAVYKAFRSRIPKGVQGDPGLDAVRALESTLRRPVAEIDREFAQWFGQPGGRSGQSLCR